VKEAAMSIFWLYRRKDGDIGWRLRDDNNEIIAIAGEGFTTEKAARDSIANVKAEAPKATVRISEKYPI
jgi:uncharacterized protein YegP (UPF0339 family)